MNPKSNNYIYRKIILLIFGFLFILNSTNFAQKSISVALIAPEKNFQIEGFRNDLRIGLETQFRIEDFEMCDHIFASEDFPRPFNLNVEDAISFGNRLGVNYLVLLRSTRLKRILPNEKVIYEAFFSAHVVSSRSGRLKEWVYRSFESDDPLRASRLLEEEILSIKNGIAVSISKSEKDELKTSIVEKPSKAKPEKSALPYRRISPEYTPEAARYKIEATIDAVVEIDEFGRVGRIDFVRWAGYGLEKSVERAIRKMNWRPASSNGKFLPSEVMLRYNFADIQPKS